LGFAAYRLKIGLFYNIREIYRHVLHSPNVPLTEYYFSSVFILWIDQTLVVALVGGHAE
jgi:hypothetical protein